MVRAIIKSLVIHPLYIVTLFLYATPPLSLFIFIFQQLFVASSDAMFWVIFLVSLSPCGLIGGILSLIGIVLSRKKNKLNVFIGVVGAFIGLGCVAAGVLGYALIIAVLG